MSYVKANPRATGGLKPTSPTVESTALDARLQRFLENLAAAAFFGKVVVSFQNGKVTDVKTEQTRKLEEL